MKQTKKNDIRLYIIFALILVILCLVIFGIIYAVKNYNADEKVKLNNFDAKYTLSNDQLDAVTQPTPNLALVYEKLPEAKDTINEIDFNTFKKLFQTKAKSLLVLVKDNCAFCEDYLPKFEEALKSYDIKAYKINISNLSKDEMSKLYDFIDFDGTPTTYVIDQGKATHTLSGTTDLDTLKAFIDYFYIRNN